MAQFARPASDVSTNSWAAEPPGTGLFEAIYEETPSDSEYIQHNAVALCEVALDTLTDPSSSVNHVVRYRLGRSVTNRTLTIVVRLIENATERASWTHTDPAISFGLFEQTLSGAQADSITNYADLRLRFDITAIQNNQV